MTVQQLFEIPAQPVLTERQQLAWDYLRSIPGGVTADELGAMLHSQRERRPHSADERCVWCAREGLSVLRSKAIWPLVIRRRSGLWEPRDPAECAQEPSAQLDELPEWLAG